MPMINYVFAICGIVVSVATFLIGYRQTFGARKERIASANTDLERIVLRRVVLESFSPGREDIDRLRYGKSREYRVAVSDILLPIELMNSVYTHIVDNDYISPDLRKEIIARIDPLFEKLSKAEEQEPEAMERGIGSSVLPILFAILASVLGAAVSVLPQFRSIALGKKDAIELVAITGGVSVAIIAIYLLFNRLREQQEEGPARSSGATEEIELTRAVMHAVRRAGLSIVRPPRPSGYDFEVVTKAGAKVLVEIKAWPKRVPKVIIRALVERLSDRVAKEGAKEALVVVREPLDLPVDVIGTAPVRIITVREVRNYFVQ